MEMNGCFNKTDTVVHSFATGLSQLAACGPNLTSNVLKSGSAKYNANFEMLTYKKKYKKNQDNKQRKNKKPL